MKQTASKTCEEKKKANKRISKILLYQKCYLVKFWLLMLVLK